MKILIVHAAWLDERKRTLARLLEQVPDATVLSSRRPEHASVWARRAWEWCEDAAEPVAVLNDDVIVCPSFSDVCDAMVAAAPGRALSLHTSVPDAIRVVGSSWVRCYWLTGPGYILPSGIPTKLLDFWAALPRVFGPNEDNVAIQWAWSEQIPFWSSIPAIVQHDTETKSTLGYDNHKLRTSCVPWTDFPDADLSSVAWWRRGVDAPPFVENPWARTDHLHAMRRALETANPCTVCWTRVANVGHPSGQKFCGPCLAQIVGPLFNSLRHS